MSRLDSGQEVNIQGTAIVNGCSALIVKMSKATRTDGGRGGASSLSPEKMSGSPSTKTAGKKVPPGAIKSGRQRKKTATRAKGGEFRATTEKKRVYFCCISSEMEMEGLMEELKASQPAERVTICLGAPHHVPGARNAWICASRVEFGRRGDDVQLLIVLRSRTEESRR